MAVTIEYAAGFFDGEGCVNIQRRIDTRPRRAGVGPGYLRLRVSVCNTHVGVLKALCAKFGGSVWTRVKSKPNHKPVFQWNISGPEAAVFLRAIRPHIIVKTEQIDHWLACYDFVSSGRSKRCVMIAYAPTGKKGGCSKRSVRTAETVERETFYLERMAELNKRGVA